MGVGLKNAEIGLTKGVGYGGSHLCWLTFAVVSANLCQREP